MPRFKRFQKVPAKRDKGKKYFKTHHSQNDKARDRILKAAKSMKKTTHEGKSLRFTAALLNEILQPKDNDKIYKK